MLKTRRLGYDGKGQRMIGKTDDPAAAWTALAHAPSILEGFVAFEREVSVVAARSRDGHVACFDLIENEHRDHILKLSRVPAAVPAALAQEARRIAEAIAGAFDYVGVLAVEMFVVRDGARQPCWSTRSRRACTIPAIGRSMAARSRNSSSTFARSPAGRWPARSAAAGWK